MGDLALVEREYGTPAIVRRKFEDAGITLLEDGTHAFTLDNGASLTVYASPYTPSREGWGFSYDPADGHAFNIQQDTDVVMTHGSPHGAMDRTGGDQPARIGCPRLFEAISTARPRLHCFGHAHRGWGAKLMKWKHTGTTASPTHFTAFDNEGSVPIHNLADIQRGKFDSDERWAEKRQLLKCLAAEKVATTSHCADDQHPLLAGSHTLFVNAAVESADLDTPQRPWIVGIDLPKHTD
jgi:hypothetical protein